MIVACAIVSAAGDERTPTVITLQYRLNHEVHPGGSTRCRFNINLLCVVDFLAPRFGALPNPLCAVFFWHSAGVIA